MEKINLKCYFISMSYTKCNKYDEIKIIRNFCKQDQGMYFMSEDNI